jgi:hypothetical protein
MTRANQEAIHDYIQDAEHKFKDCLEEAIEHAFQEINETADDATEHMNQQAEQLIQEMMSRRLQTTPTWKTAEPKPSKLFLNVDVSKIHLTSINSAAPAAATISSNDTALEWGKDGPVTNDSSHTFTPPPVQFHSLPSVSHTDMLKRVHTPYPGRDQSYLWYLQLRSNGNQYGVYLISTEDFKKDKSLFPTNVYGVSIDTMRYNEMKCTLYHFLAQYSIISAEYTDLRNIINRNAVTTDGYRVLYDIMALWLHLKAGSKLLDEKLRLKILANYAELDAKRRSKKIGKIRGTVRLLYENGQFEEGDKLLDSAIPSKQNMTVDSTLDDSDSDASNSS